MGIWGRGVWLLVQRQGRTGSVSLHLQNHKSFGRTSSAISASPLIKCRIRCKGKSNKQKGTSDSGYGCCKCRQESWSSIPESLLSGREGSRPGGWPNQAFNPPVSFSNAMAVQTARDMGPSDFSVHKLSAVQAGNLLLSLIFIPLGAVVNGESEKALLEVTEDRF